MLNEFRPMAQIGLQGTHFGIEAKGAIEQAEAMELLQPERFASPGGIDNPENHFCDRTRS